MARIKVFLSYTDDELKGYYSQAGLDELKRHAEPVFNTTGRILHGEELAFAAAGCQIILAHRSAAGDAATFDASPQLLAFLRAAVDISTVDVQSASQHGILVTRASAGFGTAVAELGLAMMLDLARGISRARHAYEQALIPMLEKGLQLRNSSVGILGYGAIGKELASMSRALGMEVRVFDPHVDEASLMGMKGSLESVVPQSDFVVCLAASVPQTHNMINDAFFASMKEGASFLNLSRGELVDEDALERALDSGRLRGAGLDEGRAPDQKPSHRYMSRPDVVLMPHVGGMTHQAREHQTMDTVRQVAALAAGRWPEGAVNAAQAHRAAQFIAAMGQAS